MSTARRLTILCITSIFPPDIGGPATYLAHIAEALAARGHRLTILALSDDPESSAAPLPYTLVRLRRRTFLPLRWLRTMMAIARLGRSADVLFVHGLALEVAVANRVLGKPMVYKVVGDLAWMRAVNSGWTEDSFETFQASRYGARLELLRRMRAWWTCQATRIIAPSQYLAHWVHRWGVPQERITVIPNAVDVPRHLPAVAEPLPGRPRIAVIGRLVQWKGIDGVLRAAARLDGVGVVVVGEGPKRASLEALAASLSLGTRVRFTGRKTNEDTLALMAACDIFVLNSTYEGLPHVVIEAMSLGLAVVATAAGGTPELVHDGETGLLVPPGDDAALTAALARLLAAPDERARLARSSLAWAQRFTFGHMVDATERALVEAVDAP